MAKCDLRFEVEDDEGPLLGGQSVRGRLIVLANETIKCNALTVCHQWYTHGSGNVDKGQGPEVRLFSGELQPGQREVFDFEVRLLPRPPTYHGHHLNIDHVLAAQVDIPWAFDVKETHPIRLLATSGEASDEDQSIRLGGSGKVSKLIALILLPLIMGVVFLAIPVVLIGLLLMTFVGGGYWFFRSFLPRWTLGHVEMQLDSPEVAVGQSVSGTFAMVPRKRVQIEGVECTLTGREVCVSGSGSNRRTHRHEFHTSSVRLLPEGRVLPGEAKYPLSIPIPDSAPPSLKLSDNRIEWTLELRVGIPRWPDYRQSETLQVQPRKVDGEQPQASPIDERGETDGAEVGAAGLAGGAAYAQPWESQSGARGVPGQEAEGVGFGETARLLAASADDNDQIQQVVQAVQGLDFQISARIDRTLLYTAPDERELAYPGGRTALAIDTATGLKLTLYFPEEQTDLVSQLTQEVWDGRAVVMGYDFPHDRLRMRVL